MRASDRSIAPSSEFDVLVCRYWYLPDYGRPRMRMSLAISRSVTTLTIFGDDVVPNTNEEITDLEVAGERMPDSVAHADKKIMRLHFQLLIFFIRKGSLALSMLREFMRQLCYYCPRLSRVGPRTRILLVHDSSTTAPFTRFIDTVILAIHDTDQAPSMADHALMDTCYGFGDSHQGQTRSDRQPCADWSI